MKSILTLFVILFSVNVLALPYQKGWGVLVSDETNKAVKIGGRIQALALNEAETETQDFYLRRLRLNVLYRPWEDHIINFDIRNDGANEADDGEQGFNIGDGYWAIKLQDNKWFENIKFFRSKVDVSYSQTASSKNLIVLNRAEVAEFASDFVVHNRRANNINLNGIQGRLSYHIALSDGVHSEDLEDIGGNAIASIEAQKFSYGAKTRFYLWGHEGKRPIQETFYGNHDTFSFGVGHFRNDKIMVTNDVGGSTSFNVNRSLTNYEISFAHKGLRLLLEYFTFEGRLIDLNATDTENILGDAEGGYLIAEYVFNKWAPFFRIQQFDQAKDLDDTTLNSSTFGINFYDDLEARRYGAYIKKSDIADEQEEEIGTYIMMNF